MHRLQAMDCPVWWCDRQPNGHVSHGVHQGVILNVIASEPWRSGVSVLQVVAKGRLEDSAVLGLTIINEHSQQLSAVLTWDQVKKLRKTLDEAVRRLGCEDYEALYPGNEEPGESMREAFGKILDDGR